MTLTAPPPPSPLTCVYTGFCAGADIASLAGGVAEYQIEDQNDMSSLILKIRSAPQIFIGVVHGGAAGAGLSLASACDIRIGVDNLKANCAFTLLGLTGAEMGSSFLLPQWIGAGPAAEMMLTGRFMYAEEALARGWVSSLYPTLDEALDAAGETAAHLLTNVGPRALRMTKDAINANVLGSTSLESAIALEDRQQVLCLHDPQCFQVGMKYAMRFMSKM